MPSSAWLQLHFHLDVVSKSSRVIGVAYPIRAEHIQRRLRDGGGKQSSEPEAAPIAGDDLAALPGIRHFGCRALQLHAADLLPTIHGGINCNRNLRPRAQIDAVTAVGGGKPIKRKVVPQKKNSGAASGLPYSSTVASVIVLSDSSNSRTQRIVSSSEVMSCRPPQEIHCGKFSRRNKKAAGLNRQREQF